MKYQIHVNVHVIRYNAKHGTRLPQVRIQEGNKTTYCREVEIGGPSKLVSPLDKLKCGARVWLETDGPIHITGKVPYREIKEAMV